MALATTITPAKIAVAVGTDAPAEGTPQALQWQMWIDDALMLIQARVDELKVDETTITEAKLDYVIREAVVAHVRNPDSATQVTVSVDDGSSSKVYRSSSGRVEIADEWWSFLGLTPSGGQAFQIDTAPPCGGYHLPWCSALTYTAPDGMVTYGGAYCTCGADIAGRPIYEV